MTQTETMSDEQQLRDLIGTVERGIERTRARLVRETEAHPMFFWEDSSPEDMLDNNGRPILLDMQVRLLDARATLARMTHA